MMSSSPWPRSASWRSRRSSNHAITASRPSRVQRSAARGRTRRAPLDGPAPTSGVRRSGCIPTRRRRGRRCRRRPAIPGRRGCGARAGPADGVLEPTHHLEVVLRLGGEVLGGELVDAPQGMTDERAGDLEITLRAEIDRARPARHVDHVDAVEAHAKRQHRVDRRDHAGVHRDERRLAGHRSTRSSSRSARERASCRGPDHAGSTHREGRRGPLAGPRPTACLRSLPPSRCYGRSRTSSPAPSRAGRRPGWEPSGGGG